MSTAGWKWIVLLGSVILQWYILGSWIYREENTLRSGVFIKIPCQQLDPKDPFRGTYLRINPIPAQIEFEDSLLYATNQYIWVNYEHVTGDVYRFYSIQPYSEKPDLPVHIRARIKYIYPVYPDSLYSATIEYPFSNLYVNEKAAPQMVEKYNQALSDTTIIVYAGLHVLRGNAALNGLWIGDDKLE